MKSRVYIGGIIAFFAIAAIVTVMRMPPEQKQAAASQPQKQQHAINDQKSFDKNTKTQGMMPYGKAELEYEIKVPKDWEADEKMGAQAPIQETKGQ